MSNIKFFLDKNGVANLEFDLLDQKVNILSKDVLAELESSLNAIDGNKAIRILLISSAKKDNFIAGADINEIKDIKDIAEAKNKVTRGQNILSKLANLKIPTIAVINGSCLGGGLELALACKYRVAVIGKKTLMGLPEVNLGIIPGFGGTQRLPKLVGATESLKIILSGKPIDVNKAFKIGLVDLISHKEFLEENLTKFVTEIIEKENKNQFLVNRNSAAKKRFIFESILLVKYFIYYFASKDLWEKTKGKYPAPFYALEVVKRTYGNTYSNKGFAIEVEAFCELVIGNICKNLIDLFFISEKIKKDSGIIGKEFDFKEYSPKNAAVIGAGVMGGGIAWLFANNDINVRIKDVSQKAISIGYNQIFKVFDQLKKIKKLTKSQIDIKSSKVTSSLDFNGFANVDFIVEAVVENLTIKKNLISELEKKVPGNAIIVSNTSSLSIDKMSESLTYPERFAGMHFFNPVNKMPLVEVIRGKKTSDVTIAKVVSLAKSLGKTPIVVKDKAGFLVNRILLPYMNEASYILQENNDIGLIDKLIEDFGMPMGPFLLADVVGIDVGCKVALLLEENFHERMRVSDLLMEIYLNHKNLLGKKTEKGFYIHENNSSTNLKINPEISEIIKKLQISKNITSQYILEKDIVERCFMIMINEAARCIEEGIVKDAQYLDMAMIMGTGFPAFRGGILKYADNIGISKVVENLNKFQDKISQRFEVCDLLNEMSSKNQRFYN